MGKIVGAYILPHPPIIIPEIGKGTQKDAMMTIRAMEKMAVDIKEKEPTTIVVISPHAPVFQDYVYIAADDILSGDFSQFGSPETAFRCRGNRTLVNQIIKESLDMDLYAGNLDPDLMKKYKISNQLDHGVLVPLYFILKYLSHFKLVQIASAALPYYDLYRFGRCIQKAVEKLDENVVVIASGDLSHRLSQKSPYGYHDAGPEFDAFFMDSIKHLDVEKILNIEEGFCENAGECGLRSSIMLLGVLDGIEVKPEIQSYEGPYGIGYGVVSFHIGAPSAKRQALESLEQSNREKIKNIREKEDRYVSLARNTLELFVVMGINNKMPDLLPEEMLITKAGIFVSIKKEGRLRGCIGTIEPTQDNIALEIIHNAISAGTKDPRFDPVQKDELDKLVYSVDVLSKAEMIASKQELDVHRYGVIVSKGNKRGLLLPNLEGVESVDEQVNIALQKAGIDPSDNYRLERFEVVRHY